MDVSCAHACCLLYLVGGVVGRLVVDALRGRLLVEWRFGVISGGVVLSLILGCVLSVILSLIVILSFKVVLIALIVSFSNDIFLSSWLFLDLLRSLSIDSLILRVDGVIFVVDEVLDIFSFFT